MTINWYHGEEKFVPNHPGGIDDMTKTDPHWVEGADYDTYYTVEFTLNPDTVANWYELPENAPVYAEKEWPNPPTVTYSKQDNTGTLTFGLGDDQYTDRPIIVLEAKDTVTLAGKVTGPDNEPVSAATISLVEAEVYGDGTIKSDGDTLASVSVSPNPETGEFTVEVDIGSIADMTGAPGKYFKVAVNAEGYKDAEICYDYDDTVQRDVPFSMNSGRVPYAKNLNITLQKEDEYGISLVPASNDGEPETYNVTVTAYKNGLDVDEGEGAIYYRLLENEAAAENLPKKGDAFDNSDGGWSEYTETSLTALDPAVANYVYAVYVINDTVMAGNGAYLIPPEVDPEPEDPTEAVITLTVTGNTCGSSTVGNVTVSAGEESKKVTVAKGEVPLSISKTAGHEACEVEVWLGEQKIEAADGVYKLTVDGSTAVTVTFKHTQSEEKPEARSITIAGPDGDASSEITVSSVTQEIQLTAAVAPAEADQTVTWTVAPANQGVTIDETGKVSVISAAQADTYTVTATAKDVAAVTQTYTITVKAAERTDAQIVADAVKALQDKDNDYWNYSVNQSDMSEEEDIRADVQARVDTILSATSELKTKDGAATVTKTAFSAAKESDGENPAGTDGAYSYKVVVKLNEATNETVTGAVTIKATPNAGTKTITFTVAEGVTIEDLKVDDEDASLTSGKINVASNAVVTFTLDVAEGYEIDTVTGAEKKDGHAFYTVTAGAVTITVKQSTPPPAEKTITFTVPTGVTIAVKVNGEAATLTNGTITVMTTDVVTFTLTVNSAYTLGAVTGATKGEDGAYTVSAATVTIAASAKSSAPSAGGTGGSSSSGGSASGGTTGGSTTGTTTTAPDGITTTTTTSDGTKTETVTATDGTVTETKTKADGAKTETVREPDGDVKVTASKANGEVVAKVEIPAVIPTLTYTFEDVPSGHWAESAINTMAALSIVQGESNDGQTATFNMEGNITRGAMAQILYNLSQGTEGKAETCGDVAEGAWYADAVAWASDAGVVTGYSDNSFGPDDSITREQLAVMLYRYADLLGLDTAASGSLNSFSDAGSVSSWATDAISWAVSTGLIQGKGANNLDPLASATRAETAVIFQRFLDLVK